MPRSKPLARLCRFSLPYALRALRIDGRTRPASTAGGCALCSQHQCTRNSFDNVLIDSLCSLRLPENRIFLLPQSPHSSKHAGCPTLEPCSSSAEQEHCLFLFFLVLLGWVFNYLLCFFVFSHRNSPLFFIG